MDKVFRSSRRDCVFISSSKQDRDSALIFMGAMRKVVAGVFLDTYSLVAGDEFAKKLRQEIERADIVVVLLSEYTNHSYLVQSEITTALEHKKLVIHVLFLLKRG